MTPAYSDSGKLKKGNNFPASYQSADPSTEPLTEPKGPMRGAAGEIANRFNPVRMPPPIPADLGMPARRTSPNLLFSLPRYGRLGRAGKGCREHLAVCPLCSGNRPQGRSVGLLICI